MVSQDSLTECTLTEQVQLKWVQAGVFQCTQCLPRQLNLRLVQVGMFWGIPHKEYPVRVAGTHVGTSWELQGDPHCGHPGSMAGSEADVNQEVLGHSMPGVP